MSIRDLIQVGCILVINTQLKGRNACIGTWAGWIFLKNTSSDLIKQQLQQPPNTHTKSKQKYLFFFSFFFVTKQIIFGKIFTAVGKTTTTKTRTNNNNNNNNQKKKKPPQNSNIFASASRSGFVYLFQLWKCCLPFFCFFFMEEKKKTQPKSTNKQRNVLKKRSHLKIRWCTDSYSLMKIGFKLETLEKSKKALKLKQQM